MRQVPFLEWKALKKSWGDSWEWGCDLLKNGDIYLCPEFGPAVLIHQNGTWEFFEPRSQSS